MKLSVIIVHYNVAELLENCLNSLQKYLCAIDYEIIVIDNSSPDLGWKTLVKEFPKVKFLSSDLNQGFAVANNSAVTNASGEYLLFLNPDTELEDFEMQNILNFCDSEKNFGCLGVRMHDKSGNFLPESKRSVPNIFNSFEKLWISFKNNNHKSYYRNDIAEDEIASVEVVTGAFLLIKRKTYSKVGGFDPAYFMYGEDIDLCYTLIKNGFKNFYYGKSTILHYKGESTIKDRIYLQRFYGAMAIFLKKYYKKDHFLQYLLLMVGLSLKFKLEKLKLK